MPEPVRGKGRYMPGIDGLRALAVLAVIIYHLIPSWLPGGLLGVGVFFVLSGYLITDLLIAEWKTIGRIHLKDFWIRRFRRLIPALILMLGVVTVWIIMFDRTRLHQLLGDLSTSLLYVNNWWLIFHHVSYFESFGPPSPIGHLWSLAVEEQFYLLWPFVLSLGLRFIKQRGKLAGLILAGAAVSALGMAMMYEPGTDPSRVYYGTDTRAFALLIGAAVAVVWPSYKLSSLINTQERRFLDFTGGVGLLVICFMIWSTNQYDAFLYRGGLVILSVAVAITVAVLAHPSSLLGSAMGCKPLRWLGVRSYGIYLWHYPVIVLSQPSVNTGGVDLVRCIVQLGITIVLAALSWKLVEEPIRSGTWKRYWNKQHSRKEHRFRIQFMRGTVIMTALVILGGSCLGKGGGMKESKASILEDVYNVNTVQNPIVTNEPSLSIYGPTWPVPAASDMAESAADADSNSNSGSSSSTEAEERISEPVQKPCAQGVSALGDSVMLDIAPYLEALIPGITIDGKVGRQMSEAQGVVDKFIDEGHLGSCVIIELGTNGTFVKKQLVTLLESLKDRQRVILVNTRVPRPWEENVNSMLRETAEGYPDVFLVDWYTASANKNGYFEPDGVHLNVNGAKVYASLVAESVNASHN